MPSHLTRQVFRRLIANEPIIYSGCLRRRAYSTPSGIQHGSNGRAIRLPVVRRYQQRRTLFGLGMFRTKAPRDAREASYDPGIDKMMEYAKMERMRARLPPVEEVADAWREFFTAKRKRDAKVEDIHARLALQSLNYCLKAQKEALEDGRSLEGALEPDHLCWAAVAVSRQIDAVTMDHVRLADAIYAELVASGAQHEFVLTALKARMQALACTGHTLEARELLLREEHTMPSKRKAGDRPPKDASDLPILDIVTASKAWVGILRGFAAECDEPHLLETLEMLQQRGLGEQVGVANVMLQYFLTTGDVASVKHWWAAFRNSSAWTESSLKALSIKQTSNVLRWCLRTDNLSFGQEVVRDVMRTNPEKEAWDAVFVWAAGTKKSVDEIARMMDVMEKSNESIPKQEDWRRADIATINALVEYAISQNDPYMAERFINLGRDRGIEPDARTFILQMDYRLSVGDVDGALVAYTHRQAHDLDTDEDFPAINRLLVALCTSQRHDFDTIMNVAADLSDRRARFEPLTVSSLSILHLNRDELHDVIDLLNTHVFSFSSTDRDSVRQTLTDYALLPTTDTTRAWDAYTILRSIFDEMPREPRTELMRSFLSRDRPDMAVHVFNHMRAHSRSDTMPTIDTYVSAFLGCAKLRDLESLEVIHNQLKLDYNVTPTTYVRNALVIAYTACDKPRRALDFWDDIVASREGPTYDSIHIALRACEKSPFGDLKAQGIWERLRRNNVELDTSMWASYIAALAGNGDNELAISTLEKAVEDGELEVDLLVLASLFNAAPGQVKQAEIEGFARSRFGDVWEGVGEVGMETDENGMRRVRVDRSVTP